MCKKRFFLACFMTSILALHTMPEINTKTKNKSQGQKKDVKDVDKDIFQWFQTYSEVVSLVEKKAFRSVDFAKFIQDSLKSAVAHVDAHSAFFTPKSYKATMESTSGEFSGIGVSIITKIPEDEALVIIGVIQNGPAEAAGLESGDKIVEVNGKKLKGLASDEVISMLKGKSGTEVTLKVIRKKKPLTFTVKRDIIKDQTSICYKFTKQNIYYLSLRIFNEIAATQMSELLRIANDGKCKGIVLDLRRNPGGTLDSAIDMAGLFLNKESVVVTTKDKDAKLVATYSTKKDPILKSTVPVFILIDNFTASAAEILAGSLQYHSEHKDNHKNLMVFLVGTPTFGKGSVQELIPVKNGCALKITTMLYYLPGNKSIQALGINPDFTVKPKYTPTDEMKWVQELYGKESSLKNHITVEEVQKKDRTHTKKDETKKDKKRGFWHKLFGKKNKDQKQDQEEEKEEDQEEEEENTGKQEKTKEKKLAKKDKKKSWEERQKESLASDVQVQASVNLINLLDVAKRTNPKLVNSRKKVLKFLHENYVTDDKIAIEKIK